MQKTRRLVDEMFLIQLSFIALGSESQISVFKQCKSNTQMSVVVIFGGSMRRSQNLEISVKKKPAYSTSHGSISRVFH